MLIVKKNWPIGPYSPRQAGLPEQILAHAHIAIAKSHHSQSVIHILIEVLSNKIHVYKSVARILDCIKPPAGVYTGFWRGRGFYTDLKGLFGQWHSSHNHHCTLQPMSRPLLMHLCWMFLSLFEVYATSIATAHTSALKFVCAVSR